jgi:phospholipid/cholesterol/gamma-HCH transport system substrate-binding protein
MATPFSNTPRGSAQKRGMKPWVAGVIFIGLVAIACYFAFTKSNPFADRYELYAVFDHANELKERSPVRIAGVEVGKVKEVEPYGDSGKARVRMEIEDSGLPIREDAKLKIRQRLFLEGNYFVDLQPGSPSARELDSGETIGPSQTAAPVQFGQFLTALQQDTREDLQTFLREYSKALEGRGAAGFNQAVRYWEPAYKATAQSTRATLGQQPGDLQRVLKGQGTVFGALSRDERALRGLVTHLNRVMAAFASQDANLKATVPRLRNVLRTGRPALQSLNSAFPTLRAFARDALPGARSSSPTLDVQLPFIRQARRLVSREELGGLSRELRLTVPHLARLNRSQISSFAQTRALASCQNNVLLPWTTTPIPDPDFPANSGEPFFEQSPRAFVGLSGESRAHDANSPWFRVQVGSGSTTTAATGETGERLFAQLDFPLDGVRPIRPTTRPVFRPGVPCETQEPPDLNAPNAAGDPEIEPNPNPSSADRRRMRRAQGEWRELLIHLERVQRGQPSVDPLEYSELGERMAARRLGLRRNPDGTYDEPRRGDDSRGSGAR